MGLKLLFVINYGWRGISLRIKFNRVQASWLKIGFVGFVLIPRDGLWASLPLFMQRDYPGKSKSSGIALFIAFDNPFQPFRPSYGRHRYGIVDALALPFISFGLHYAGFPLVVHANYK